MDSLDPALIALTTAGTLGLVQVIKQAVPLGNWAALVSLVLAIAGAMALSATISTFDGSLGEAAVTGFFAGLSASGAYSGVVKPAVKATA